MTTQEWEILLGIAVAVALAIGPWMFQVHAKLAVIADNLGRLCEETKVSLDERRRLWEAHFDLAARLEQQEQRLECLIRNE